MVINKTYSIGGELADVDVELELLDVEFVELVDDPELLCGGNDSLSRRFSIFTTIKINNIK